MKTAMQSGKALQDLIFGFFIRSLRCRITLKEPLHQEKKFFRCLAGTSQDCGHRIPSQASEELCGLVPWIWFTLHNKNTLRTEARALDIGGGNYSVIAKRRNKHFARSQRNNSTHTHTRTHITSWEHQAHSGPSLRQSSHVEMRADEQWLSAKQAKRRIYTWMTKSWNAAGHCVLHGPCENTTAARSERDSCENRFSDTLNWRDEDNLHCILDVKHAQAILYSCTSVNDRTFVVGYFSIQENELLIWH